MGIIIERDDRRLGISPGVMAFVFITIFFMIATILTLLSNVSKAIPIFVSINGKIDGTLSYVNLSVNATTRLVKIISVWENTGSAGCKVLMRADVRDTDGDVIYTSWSALKRVPPGGVATLENYWYYNSLDGNYTVRLRLYFCDEIRNYGEINVTLPSGETKERRPIRINAISYVPASNTSAILVKLEFPSNFSKKRLNGVIVPLKTPLGDKIYPVKLKDVRVKKNTIELTIPWDYGVLVTEKIPMVLVDTVSGEAYMFDVTTQVKKKESLFDRFVALVSHFRLWMLACMLLIVALLTIKGVKNKKIKQRNIRQRKENKRKREQGRI